MFAEQLVNKLLHPQISAIKAQSRREDAADSLRVLARALGVDDIPAAPKHEAQPQPENQS